MTKNYTIIIERDKATGLLVGYIPGWPGAHTQAATMEELTTNMQEVIAMLTENAETPPESEFVGTQNLAVTVS